LETGDTNKVIEEFIHDASRRDFVVPREVVTFELEIEVSTVRLTPSLPLEALALVRSRLVAISSHLELLCIRE
jgi:hypothetical protein